jgi:hypothetical protein
MLARSSMVSSHTHSSNPVCSLSDGPSHHESVSGLFEVTSVSTMPAHESSSLAGLSHWRLCSHGGSSPYVCSCAVGLADAFTASGFGAWLKLH